MGCRPPSGVRKNTSPPLTSAALFAPDFAAAEGALAIGLPLDAAKDGVATKTHENLVQAVQDAMWQPVYPPSDVQDRK